MTGPVQLQALDLLLPESPSSTLLLFTSVGQDPDAYAFADGLGIDIRNAPVKLADLFLIAAGLLDSLDKPSKCPAMIRYVQRYLAR